LIRRWSCRVAHGAGLRPQLHSHPPPSRGTWKSVKPSPIGATTTLPEGEGVRGAVEGISYGIEGPKVELSLQDGSGRAIPFKEIYQIDGIADLLADNLIAA
jgi:hypothetical protein